MRYCYCEAEVRSSSVRQPQKRGSMHGTNEIPSESATVPFNML